MSKRLAKRRKAAVVSTLFSSSVQISFLEQIVKSGVLILPIHVPSLDHWAGLVIDFENCSVGLRCSLGLQHVEAYADHVAACTEFVFRALSQMGDIGWLDSKCWAVRMDNNVTEGGSSVKTQSTQETLSFETVDDDWLRDAILLEAKTTADASQSCVKKEPGEDRSEAPSTTGRTAGRIAV